MRAPMIGEVIAPATDVTERGGPSGHETCRWRLRMTDGTEVGCLRTAGHHTSKRDELAEHYDPDLMLFWDRAGRLSMG